MQIQFPTAKLAKVKGFDSKTLFCYLENGDLQYSSGDLDDHEEYNHNKWDNYSAPLQFELQKWLREKHNIHIEIYFNQRLYCVCTIGKGEIKDLGFEFKTYEDALEQGLLEGLKLI